jgi:hypothetical protein
MSGDEMTKIKLSAFAAVDTRDKPPHICVWTVSGTAAMVRQKIGKAWLPDDPKAGWRGAKIEGMRVIKIDMAGDL